MNADFQHRVATTCASRVAAAVCAFLFAAGAAQADDPTARRLAEYHLEPTAASLSEYLASLQPTPERQKQLRELILQLDDPDFARREDAKGELLRQVGGIAPLLDEAIRGENPEIRWRAKIIRDQTSRENRAILSTVLAAIHERKIVGLAAPLLGALPHCDDQRLRQQLHRALVATASPADTGLLRQQLAASDAQARLAAIVALAAVQGADADADAVGLLADPAEAVQAAAARELANHGRREALPVRVRLLESSEMAIRARAIQTLRASTGQQFNYSVYATPDERSRAIAAWKTWLAGEGMTAPLAVPLAEGPVWLGRLLVCDYAQHKLVEFDAAGKQVWEKGVGAQPWACQGLPSGHRLVGSYQEKSIAEYDARGEAVWRYDGLPGGPTSVERLESGNTLVACTEGEVVVEIDPAKKIVWQAKLLGRPVDARRLEDGRTLVTLQNAQKIVEVDSAGMIVWEISGVGQAFSAERLDSGNTLVSGIGHSKVREFDRAGRVVWERGSFTNPYTAQRLLSGNTIVVDTTGVIEIDPQGTVVSRLARGNLSRAWSY